MVKDFWNIISKIATIATVIMFAEWIINKMIH